MPVKKTVNKKPPQVKAKTKKYYYFRIFDDKEELNYLRTSLTRKQLERYLRAYEKTHSKYFNPEFVKYLKKYDKKVEIIEVSDISY